MSRFPSALPAAAMAALLATGCAGLAPAPASVTATQGAVDTLRAARAALTTPEDSLVLDLVLGHRLLEAGITDAAAYQRARAARNQLEYMLLHGGVKDRGREARALSAPEGRNLTLGESAGQLSAALLHAPPGTAWRPPVERARDIQRHRAALGILTEDAAWVIALDDALAGNLPAETKLRLRALHEAYADRAPHAEVAAHVSTLLTEVRDERLQRELKKLANRSWERERRDGPRPARAPEHAAPVTPSTAPALPPAPPPPPVPAEPAAPAAPPAPAVDTANAAAAAADTGVPGTSPERYCAERRTEAAQAFAAARAATDPAERTRELRRSLALLDDCISRYPDTPEAEKARQNRVRVAGELSP